MKRILLAALIGLSITSPAQEVDSLKIFIDNLESQLRYEQGEITLANGIGTLRIPDGFKYLDSTQSAYVLQDLWGNPEGAGTLGMILPSDNGVLSDNAWAFIVTYEPLGYVEDDDATDIDYDDLLKDMQEETAADNEARLKEGYETIELVGWAAKPFYDSEKKVLHWAKELRFGEAESNTLNYNVRLLGRKGVLVLNAVSSIEQLPEVQLSIAPVVAGISYADGNRYSDFNPEIDEVAAWTIGGLVAGKVLTKVGIFGLLLKNLKLVGIAIAALAGGIWKWYRRKTELPEVKKFPDTPQA